MKKKATSLLPVLGGAVFFLASAGESYARQVCPGGNFDNLCNLRLEEGNTFGKVIEILLILAIVIALVFLVLGGIRWISSGGDKGKIDSARGTITAAIIGLVIALLAYFIVNTVFYFTTGGNLGNLAVPTLLD